MNLQLLSRPQPNDFKVGSKSDKELFQRLNGYIQEASYFCEPEHIRCEENERYVRGYQWAEGDALRQKDKERPALALDSLTKVLNAVANREIMDRYVSKVFGISSEDWGVAEAMDTLCTWQRDRAETEHEESMAFRKSCASGYGVMRKWWDEAAMYGHGQIKDEEIPIWTMLWDPRARRQNLTDRRYHIYGKYVPITEIDAEFGNRKVSKKLKSIASNGGRFTDSSMTSTATGTRWGWRDVAGGRWFLSSQKELFVVELEELIKKTVYKVAVPVRMQEWSMFLSDPQGQIDLGVQDENGQPITLTIQQYNESEEDQKRAYATVVLSDTELVIMEKKAELDALDEVYETFTGQELRYSHKPKEEIHYAIITKDLVLQKGIRPMGFTFEFMTGCPFEQRDGMRFYGFADMGKGAQDMKNVLFSNLLSLYQSSSKNRIIFEEGLIDNPNQFFSDYAKVGGPMQVPDGFVGQFDQRWKMMEQQQYPPMLKELVELVSGAVESLFGLSSLETGSQGDLRRVSGTTATQAKQASNTIIAIWFDGLKRYRKRFGMLNVKYLQTMYEPKDMARIAGEEVAAGLGGIEAWPDVNRFDIKIDEAPTSISEQMQTADFLTRTGTLDKWVDSNKLAFADAIDLMVTLPKSTREKIKKNSQQMQQYEQTIQQLQDQLNDMGIKQQLFEDFLLMIDRGGQIKAQWEATYGMSEVLTKQREQYEQQMQQQAGNQAPPM